VIGKLRVPIWIANVRICIECLVIDDVGWPRQYPLLLGMQFLSDYDAVIHFGKAMLSFYFKGDRIDIRLDENDEKYEYDCKYDCKHSESNSNCQHNDNGDKNSDNMASRVRARAVTFEKRKRDPPRDEYERKIWEDYDKMFNSDLKTIMADTTGLRSRMATGVLQLKPNTKPKFIQERIVKSAPKNVAIEKQIEKYLRAGIIVTSNGSVWNSPVVAVRNNDGSFRLCIDYRYLNSCTRALSYPLMNQRDLRRALAGFSVLSKIDLIKSYHFLKLHREDQFLTAFAFRNVQYFFTVLPFGLRNSPAVFVRFINTLLSTSKYWNTHVFGYVDDVLVGAQSYEHHDVILRDVLNILSAAGMYLNAKKSKFFRTSLVVLGFKVSFHRIAIDEDKIRAVIALRAPQTIKEIKSLLGLTGYLRRFISRYAMIVAPLHVLIKLNQFYWKTPQIQAFEHLKRVIVRAPALSVYQPNSTLVIYSDASLDGAGGLLAQMKDRTKLHILGYFSHRWTQSESAWNIQRLELRACRMTVEKYADFLFFHDGKKVLRLDNKNLICLIRGASREVLPQFQRELLFIQQVMFDRVTFVKSASNPTDVLSRLLVLRRDRWAQWILHSRRELGEMKQSQLFRWRIMKHRGRFLRLLFKNGLLYVPESFRLKLLEIVHGQLHRGVAAMTHLLQPRFYFNNMRKSVIDFVARCACCVANNAPYVHSHHSLLSAKAHVPGRIFADLMGPLICTPSGNVYILCHCVCVCVYAGFGNSSEND